MPHIPKLSMSGSSHSLGIRNHLLNASGHLSPSASSPRSNSNERAVSESASDQLGSNASEQSSATAKSPSASESEQTKSKSSLFAHFHRLRRPASRLALEYYDVCLRGSDIDNFKSGNWLMDTNIEFWFEYLEREYIPEDAPILLLRPSMTFLIACTPDTKSIKDALPHKIMSCQYILLPVNDNSDVEAQAGGSHWSLTVIDVETGLARYYDSMSNGNVDDSKAVVANMSKLLERPIKLVQMSTPQQDNGSDCGVHVCMETKSLVEMICNENGGTEATSPHFLDISQKVYEADKWRSSIDKIIHKLIKERGRKIGKADDIAISSNESEQSSTSSAVSDSSRRS